MCCRNDGVDTWLQNNIFMGMALIYWRLAYYGGLEDSDTPGGGKEENGFRSDTLMATNSYFYIVNYELLLRGLI